MDEAVISVSDALVFEYLKQNGHELIARELLIVRKRDQLPNLHGIDLKAVIELAQVKGESEKSLCEENKCANNLVFKYLLVNGHIGVAREFKSCTQSRLKEDDHKEMHRKDLLQFHNTFNYKDRSKWIPIQEVFCDKLEQIKELDDGKSEVAKVLRHILEANIPIRVAQITAAMLNLKFKLDELQYPAKALTGIDTRRFSFVRFGASSDESLIDKANKSLIRDAMVLNEKSFFKDLAKLMKTHQWTMSIVGCYLSKHLRTARYPQKVCMKVVKPYVFQTGPISIQDFDVISSHLASTNGNVDLELLQKSLNRSRSDLNKIVKRLLSKMKNTQTGPFSLFEDSMILKCVLNGEKPKSLEEFEELSQRSSKSLDSLAPILNRTGQSIKSHWNGYLKTVIISLFHGNLSQDFRKIFFNYLISAKTESISQIDWNEAKKLLPSCTKQYLTDLVCGAISSTEKQRPLFQILSDNSSSRKLSKRTERRVEVAQVFDELRGKKAMSDTTKKAFENFGF